VSKHSEKKVTIKIPRNLYDRLSQIVEGTGFNSVTDFVVYVLRDLASNSEEFSAPQQRDDASLSKEEIEVIRKRLKSLGYL